MPLTLLTKELLLIPDKLALQLVVLFEKDATLFFELRNKLVSLRELSNVFFSGDNS